MLRARARAGAQQNQGPLRRSERVKAQNKRAIMSKVSKTPVRQRKPRPKALPSSPESSGDERYRPPPSTVASSSRHNRPERLAPIPPPRPTPPRQIIPGEWRPSPERERPGPPSPGPVQGRAYFTDRPPTVRPPPVRINIITTTGGSRTTTPLNPSLAPALCKLVRRDLYAAHKLPPAEREDINFFCSSSPPSAAAHFAYALHHGKLAKLDHKGAATEIPLSLAELARVYHLAWQMRAPRIQNLVVREYVKQVTEGTGVLNKEAAAEVYHAAYFKVQQSDKAEERTPLQKLAVLDLVVTLQLEREHEPGKEWTAEGWEGWPVIFRKDMMLATMRRAEARHFGLTKELVWEVTAEPWLVKEDF